MTALRRFLAVLGSVLLLGLVIGRGLSRPQPAERSDTSLAAHRAANHTGDVASHQPADLELIVERNMFSPTRRLDEARDPVNDTPVVMGSASAPPPVLRLAGIVLGATPMALLDVQNGRSGILVRVGDTISVWRVEHVLPLQVVVRSPVAVDTLTLIRPWADSLPR